MLTRASLLFNNNICCVQLFKKRFWIWVKSTKNSATSEITESIVTIVWSLWIMSSYIRNAKRNSHVLRSAFVWWLNYDKFLLLGLNSRGHLHLKTSSHSHRCHDDVHFTSKHRGKHMYRHLINKMYSEEWKKIMASLNFKCLSMYWDLFVKIIFGLKKGLCLWEQKLNA